MDLDIVLDKNEIGKYKDGIKLDIDDLIIDGNGHAACCYGGLHAQRGIFHYDGFPRFHTAFLHSLQVGLGVGLSVLDVEGRYDKFFFQ